MKVALVYATDFENISPGGIQNYLRRIIDSAPENFELTVFGVGKPPSNFAHDFVAVMDQAKVGEKLNWSFSKALARFDISKFDYVVFQRVENQLFLKRAKNQRFLQILHGGTLNAWKAKKSLFSAIYPFLEFLALIRSSKVLSVSVKNTWHYMVFRKKIFRAPRIFDSAVFNNKDLTSYRDSFALIGRLALEKNFNEAIEALSIACEQTQRNANLFIVGTGDQEKNLRSLEISHLLQINFLGQKSSAEIAHLLKTQIKTILITSSFEGFPLVALEAVACEVGVIGVHAPGVTDALIELQMTLCAGKEALSEILSERILDRLPITFNKPPVDESGLFWTSYLC